MDIYDCHLIFILEDIYTDSFAGSLFSKTLNQAQKYYEWASELRKVTLIHLFKKFFWVPLQQLKIVG